MPNTRNESRQPAFEAVFFHGIKNISLGERLWNTLPKQQIYNLRLRRRCYICPEGSRDASSHSVALFNKVCPDHLSKYLPPRATPVTPTSAFWPLFCKGFNVVAVRRVDGLRRLRASPCAARSSRAPWGALIYLWHLTFAYPTQALVKGPLNLRNSVSAHLYSTFPDSQIEYFILEHHKRLPQQLTYLTVMLHFKELHRVVSSSRDFHKLVFLVQSLKEWLDV